MGSNSAQTSFEAVTHRAVSGIEHDPSRSLFHGCCALCANPWPCDAEQELQAARLAAIRGGAQQPEDATHKLRLRLGDVKNFALALLRGHEGDSIATDIANALLRLVGSSTQQAFDGSQICECGDDAFKFVEAQLKRE